MKIKMKQNLSLFLIIIFSVYHAMPVIALDYYEQGVLYFNQNNFTDAIPLLYQASLLDSTNPKVYLYLGLSYQYTEKHADAISTFIKGTSIANADRAFLFFNAGNVYFLQDMLAESEAMYSNAIQHNASYAKAWLNRANARVKLSKYALAIDDYTHYLYLDPATWQRDAILQMTQALKDALELEKAAIAHAEAARIVAEAEQKAQEERIVAEQKAQEERLAAEQKAQEERYQKLLDSINASLQSVDGASIFSAGSESVFEYEEEGQLD